MIDKNERWTTTVFVLITVLCIRLATVFVGFASLEEDPDSYSRLAVSWSNTGTFGHLEADGITAQPTAYRPPLYPWLLSWFVTGDQLSFISVAAIHTLMGCATVWLTMLIGASLQVRYAWVAGLAVSMDPLLIRASQQVMTETLATFLGVLAWYCWLRQSSPNYMCSDIDSAKAKERRLAWIAALGIALGLSILARPTAAPWALWFAILLPFSTKVGSASAKRSSGIGTGSQLPECLDSEFTSNLEYNSRSIRSTESVGDRFFAVAILCVAIALTILPWTVRNWLAFGKPIWATTHGGYTLLLANNPSLYEHFEEFGPSRAWDAESFHAHWAMRSSGDPSTAEFWTAAIDQPSEPLSIDEIGDDALAYKAAQAAISRQPGMFALSGLYRISWFWALYPHQNKISAGTIAIGLWYGFWLIAAAIGAIRLGRTWRQTGWLAAAGLILSLTLVHAIFWSNMRMRSPTMPAIYLLGTVAIFSGQNCFRVVFTPRICVCFAAQFLFRIEFWKGLLKKPRALILSPSK